MDIVDDIDVFFFKNFYKAWNGCIGETYMLRSDREATGEFIELGIRKIFLSGRFNKSGCTPDNMMSLLGQSSCKPLCRNI